MSRIFFLEEEKRRLGTNGLKMVCVFIISLLAGACAKQTSPPSFLAFQLPMGQELTCRNVVHEKIKMEMKFCGTSSQLTNLNETGRIYEREKPGNGEKSDLQDIECRILENRGTKIKTKYCAAKAFWPYAYVCDSDYCECNEDHRLECRIYIPTGSKIPAEFCRTKAIWAEWEKINGQFAKDLLLDISNEAAIIDPEPIDSNKVPQF